MSPFKRTQILLDPINTTKIIRLNSSTGRKNFLPNPIIEWPDFQNKKAGCEQNKLEKFKNVYQLTDVCDKSN